MSFPLSRTNSRSLLAVDANEACPALHGDVGGTARGGRAAVYPGGVAQIRRNLHLEWRVAVRPFNYRVRPAADDAGDARRKRAVGPDGVRAGQVVDKNLIAGRQIGYRKELTAR